MKLTAFAFAMFACVISHAQTYDISLNLQKGKEYFQSMTTTANVVQDLEGTELSHNITMAGKISFLVKEVTEQGYQLEAKYLAVSLEMDMTTQSLRADSKHPDPASPMSLMLSSIINKSFTIGMTKKGKVTNIDGAMAIFDGMFDALPAMDDATKEQLRLQLTEAFGEKSLRTSIDAAMTFFPGKTVTVGESWDVAGRIESGMKANLNTTYQLKDVKDGYYFIEGNASVYTEKDPVSLSEFTYVYDMKGTQNTQIKIDARSGWIIEVNAKQELKGTMEMSGTMLPEKMTVPMTMKSISSVTGN